VVSFLEWKEVVGLIIGGSDRAKSCCLQVGLMHKELGRRWAVLEQSSVATLYLHSSEDVSCTLTLLADELERYPEHVDVWCSLARALGALKPCQREGKDTSILPEEILPDPIVAPLDGDEDSTGEGEYSSRITKRSTGTVPKWAKDRISWWDDQLLHISVPEGIRNKHGSLKPTKLRGDLATLRSQLGDWLEENTVAEKHGGFYDARFPNSLPKYDTVEWLEACLSQKEVNHRTASEKERAAVYDDFLPQSIHKTVGNTPSVHFESLKRPFQTLKNLSPQLQVTCYRLLIRCHIYGTTDTLVHDTIKYFICNIWNSQFCTLDTGHDHCRALEFWHSMGVDVLKVIPSLTAGESKDLLVWPLEMRRVVKDHVSRHSRPHWKRLQNLHPSIFAGCHERKAQLCYQFLLKKGLL
jgi:hypothetical protein